jgi:hypothetical protein
MIDAHFIHTRCYDLISRHRPSLLLFMQVGSLLFLSEETAHPQCLLFHHGPERCRPDGDCHNEGDGKPSLVPVRKKLFDYAPLFRIPPYAGTVAVYEKASHLVDPTHAIVHRVPA